MDVELARTFLEIVATRSFVKAAAQLHVSQTTVSARIRLLEEQFGRRLFVRNKSGATLTPAGEQFLRYAPSFVQIWHRARQQVAVPPGHRAVLTVGGEVSLWNPLLLNWVVWMRSHLPDVALHVQVDTPQDLVEQVAEGLTHIAVLYAPRARPGLTVDLLMDEELVLVTSDRSAANEAGYVHVDWGADFSLQHGASFPDVIPAISSNLGPLALGYILTAGGSGYFRMQSVKPHLDAGELRLVAGAPRLSYPIYAVYSADGDEPLLQLALEGLRASTMLDAGKADGT